MSNIYDHHDHCGVRTYTTLDQYENWQRVTISKKMECERIEKHKFNCTSTVISTWVRIWDTNYYKGYIEKCGIQWHEQYQDVM